MVSPTLANATQALLNVARLASTMDRKFELTDFGPDAVTLRAAAQEYAEHYAGDFDFMVDMRAKAKRFALSDPQAKAVLNCLRAEVRRDGLPGQQVLDLAAPRVRIAVEDAGIYVLPPAEPDGAPVIVKIKANKEKTRTYAMRWTDITGERLVETGEHRHGEYVFERGLVERVATEGRRMTLDEARRWSILYGQCIRCGRQLKDATSVERAMGPVCVKYFADGELREVGA